MLTKQSQLEVTTLKQYEMMFLFDPTFAADFQKVKEEVERILKRANAEIIFLEKWDERRLAYEIKGRKRGYYVLTYFQCDPLKVDGIDRDARLSEPILRTLIKRAEGITRERIEHFMPQSRPAEESEGASAEDGPRRGPRRAATAVADADLDLELGVDALEEIE
jgi:small subunit ribosomal protein S6